MAASSVARPPRTTRSGSGLSRLPLAQKLPLVTGGLMLLVAMALGIVAYEQARHSILEAARARLENVTGQMSNLLRGNRSTLEDLVLSIASAPALTGYLRSPRPSARDTASLAMWPDGLRPEQTFAVVLQDSLGRRVLASGAGASTLGLLPESDSLLRRTRPGEVGFGSFVQLGDTVLYPIVTAIRAPERGSVVVWRRLLSSPNGRQQIERLIGSHAALYLGNDDGGLWSDLVHAVPAPPIPLARLDSVTVYRRPGAAGLSMGMAAAVPGRPWKLLVEFQLASVLAPVDAFMRGLLVIALLCILWGLALQWLVTRRITAPLGRLTEAADAIAKGDFSREVETTGDDEVGRLADSFRTMTQRVRNSQRQLEADVAERTRDLDQALRRLRDAQDALVRRERLALLGQLASGVGHELRNPLGVMTNTVYLLEAHLPDASPRVREYLGVLSRQITLSEKIVGDLLDSARIRPPQRKIVQVPDLIEAQLQRLQVPRGVRIERRVDVDLPALDVDPVQAGQVVLNLLTNALQAVDPDDGVIAIRAERHAAGGVRVVVSDNGPGVPAEHAEKVFEPLFTTKARGIGLGLAVSRSLAQANGGELTLVAGAGRGASFAMVLPAVPCGQTA